MHISRASHICYQYQKEVGVAIDGEMHSSGFDTRYSAVQDGDDSCFVDCNLLVRGNRHVEVLERHVAPAAVVIRQG